MRKILSVALAVCMILSAVLLTACGETPEALINDAIEKTAQLEALDVFTDQNIKMSMMGTEMSMPVKTTVQLKGAEEYMEMQIIMMGIASTTVEYTDGEWVYINMDGTTYKQKKSDPSMSMFNAGSVKTLLQVLPEDLLAECEIAKNEDGSKSVSLQIPADTFVALYDPMLKNLNQTVASPDEDVTHGDADVTLTVKDGYLVKYEMSYTVSLNVEGQSIGASMKVAVDINNPGQDVVITPPEGYAAFPAME